MTGRRIGLLVLILAAGQSDTALQAADMKLSLSYAGSLASDGVTPIGSVLDLAGTLSDKNPAGSYHQFDVFMDLSNMGAEENFLATQFDIVLGAGLTPAGFGGWIGHQPTFEPLIGSSASVFSLSSDAGASSSDLQRIIVMANGPAGVAAVQPGELAPFKLGSVMLQWNDGGDPLARTGLGLRPNGLSPWGTYQGTNPTAWSASTVSVETNLPAPFEAINVPYPVIAEPPLPLPPNPQPNSVVSPPGVPPPAPQPLAAPMIQLSMSYAGSSAADGVTPIGSPLNVGTGLSAENPDGAYHRFDVFMETSGMAEIDNFQAVQFDVVLGAGMKPADFGGWVPNNPTHDPTGPASTASVFSTSADSGANVNDLERIVIIANGPEGVASVEPGETAPLRLGSAYIQWDGSTDANGVSSISLAANGLHPWGVYQDHAPVALDASTFSTGSPVVWHSDVQLPPTTRPPVDPDLPPVDPATGVPEVPSPPTLVVELPPSEEHADYHDPWTFVGEPISWEPGYYIAEDVRKAWRYASSDGSGLIVGIYDRRLVDPINGNIGMPVEGYSLLIAAPTDGDGFAVHPDVTNFDFLSRFQGTSGGEFESTDSDQRSMLLRELQHLAYARKHYDARTYLAGGVATGALTAANAVSAPEPSSDFLALAIAACFMLVSRSRTAAR